jgi:hypothetical protein
LGQIGLPSLRLNPGLGFQVHLWSIQEWQRIRDVPLDILKGLRVIQKLPNVAREKALFIQQLGLT